MIIAMNLISCLRRIQEKRRNGMLMQWAFDRLTGALSRLGVTVQVSVTYREGIVEVAEPRPRLADFTWGIATAEDLAELARARSDGRSQEEFEERNRQGARCYYLRHGNRIVGFIWCEINGAPRPRFGLSFGPRDAYVYDAYSVASYRGLNVLPFLKYQVLQDLKLQGCENVLTSTDIFNRAAQRYKAKLGACPQVVRFYLNLFGRFERVFTLYSYRSGTPPTMNTRLKVS